MADFPSGEYNCVFASTQFQIKDQEGNVVAQVPVTYAENYIFIEYNENEFSIGTSNIEDVSKDGFSESSALELGSAGIESETFEVTPSSGSSVDYNVESLETIRLIKDGSTLKTYTNHS